MRLKLTAAIVVLSACTLTGQAQMAMNSSGPSSGTTASPAKSFDSQLDVLEHEMMGAVMAMPADKFGFAPSAAIFAPAQTTKFDGVRSFAQQATHVAEANYFFYSSMSGIKPDVDTKRIQTLTQKDEVVAALAASFAFAHRAIATLTPANAFETIHSPEPGLQTKATMAAFGIAHGFDHYGQMVEYLRMNGIGPPASAK